MFGHSPLACLSLTASLLVVAQHYLVDKAPHCFAGMKGGTDEHLPTNYANNMH